VAFQTDCFANNFHGLSPSVWNASDGNYETRICASDVSLAGTDLRRFVLGAQLSTHLNLGTDPKKRSIFGTGQKAYGDRK
jgi:hypothetical protein